MTKKAVHHWERTKGEELPGINKRLMRVLRLNSRLRRGHRKAIDLRKRAVISMRFFPKERKRRRIKPETGKQRGKGKQFEIASQDGQPS